MFTDAWRYVIRLPRSPAINYGILHRRNAEESSMQKPDWPIGKKSRFLLQLVQLGDPRRILP